jgi:hypothetical protein
MEHYMPNTVDEKGFALKYWPPATENVWCFRMSVNMHFFWCVFAYVHVHVVFPLKNIVADMDTYKQAGIFAKWSFTWRVKYELMLWN